MEKSTFLASHKMLWDLRCIYIERIHLDCGKQWIYRNGRFNLLMQNPIFILPGWKRETRVTIYYEEN